MKDKAELTNHWDNVYSGKESEELTWFERTPIPSLQLIEKTDITTNSKILHVGAGLSNMVDYLYSLGFHNQIITDISEVGLNKLKKKLGDEAEKLEWITDDLRKPEHIYKLEDVDLWHDRAVLHFLTDENDLETYSMLIKSVVRFGGFVIIAVFNLEGPEKCSGLPVKRYNAQMISELLGDEFEPIDSFDYIHKAPNGSERSYVYALLSRTGKTHTFEDVTHNEMIESPDSDVPF